MDANNDHDLDDQCRAKCEKPLAEEGYELMAAVFEVHQEMGGGLAEEIYQQSLEIEFEIRGIPFKAKNQLRVFYKGRMLETCYIPDFVLHGQIVVELKSVKELATEHEAQLIELHAHHSAPCRLSGKLRPSFASPMETFRFV